MPVTLPLQVRREREFRLRDQKRKLELDSKKIDAIADMRVAMATERVSKKREERIEIDKWRSETVLERLITPVSVLLRACLCVCVVCVSVCVCDLRVCVCSCV